MSFYIDDQSGQATVEAAVLLPVVFALLGLVVQPALLLYSSCAMNAAAAETCRMLATNTMDAQAAHAFAVRRLAAVPNVSVFHCGGNGGWEIEMEGGEDGVVAVDIASRVQPLPLLGFACSAALGAEDGKIVQRAHAESALMPAWAREAGVVAGSLAGEWK